MRYDGNEGRLAQGLGWFSIALGAAELLAPGPLSRLIGVRERPAVVRALGLRELASGVGILAQRSRPAGWLWSRVAGDAIDMALMVAAFRSSGTRRQRLAAAAAAVAGVAALDIVSSRRMGQNLLPA